MSIFGRLASMGLFGLRIWAIFQVPSGYSVFICLSALLAGLFTWDILSIFGHGLITPPLAQAITNSGPELCDGWATSFTRWYPVVVIGSLIFNTFVFSLTLFRTLRRSHANRVLGIRKSLYWYLLRDGSFYYLAITISDVIFMAVVFRQNILQGDQVLALGIGPINSALETILTCRLVLNLKRLSSPSRNISAPTIQFASNRFLGNIGAPLRDSDEEKLLGEEIEEEE